MTLLFPLLAVALSAASVAACLRGTYLLVMFAFTRGAGLFGRSGGWLAVACALASAAVLCTGYWQFGVPFAGGGRGVRVPVVAGAASESRSHVPAPVKAYI